MDDKRKIELLVLFIQKLIGIMAMYFMFDYGAFFLVMSVLSIPIHMISKIAIVLLLAVWKLKFWYWIWPNLFKWTASVAPSQEWNP